MRLHLLLLSISAIGAFVHAESLPDQVLTKGLLFIEKTSAIITANNWLINVDVDLLSHKEAIQKFLKSVNSFNPAGLINDNKEMAFADENLLMLLEKEMRYMSEGGIQLLQDIGEMELTIRGITEGKREKRSLMAIGGEVLKYLFGTSTTRDFHALSNKVDNISSSSSKMVHLIKDQLTVVTHSYSHLITQQSKLSTLQKLTRFLQQDFLAFQKTQNDEITKINYRMEYLSKVLRVSRTLSDTFDNLSKTIFRLRNAFQFAMNGNLSPYFLPHKVFLQVLKEVRHKLPQGQEILSYTKEGNMNLIYNLAKLTMFYYNNNLRIFIELPVFDPAKLFHIYQTLPVPTKINNTDLFYYVQPESEFLAVSNNRELYYYLSLTELQSCSQHTMAVCTPSQTILKSTKPSCLFNLFSGNTNNIENMCDLKTLKSFDPIFHRPAHGFEYVYSVDRLTNLHATCDNEHDKQQVPQNVSGSGLLLIPNSCTVYGNTFVIFGNNPLHTGSYSIKNNIEIPQGPVFPSIQKLESQQVNLSQHKYEIINDLYKDTLNSSSVLVDMSLLMKCLQEIDSPDLAPPSITQDPTIYLYILLVAGVIITVGVFLYYFKIYKDSKYVLPKVSGTTLRRYRSREVKPTPKRSSESTLDSEPVARQPSAAPLVVAI